MNKIQAFNLIAQAVRQLRVTADEHDKIREALEIVGKELEDNNVKKEPKKKKVEEKPKDSEKEEKKE